jgi:hypothetical protein
MRSRRVVAMRARPICMAGLAAMLVAACYQARPYVAPKPAWGEDWKEVAVWSGAVTFRQPPRWQPVMEQNEESVPTFGYQVPNPVTDSSTPHRTSVMVVPHPEWIDGNFRMFTDSIFRMQMAGIQEIVADTMVGTDRRMLRWRGRVGTTPYVGIDNFARADVYWVQVRVVVPLVSGVPKTWYDQLASETRGLMQAMRAADLVVFNDSLGIPNRRVVRP